MVRSNLPDSSTEPLVACLDSGDWAIVKPFGNIQGNLVLVNEYICYRLCCELAIPIPEAGVAIIDDKTESLTDPPLFTNINYGCCFFSKRIDKATIIIPSIVPHITNKEDFYKIILFDHLVYNKDRNKGNLLVTTGKIPKLYAIDHTHVFKNETIWDRYCFKQGIEENDYNDINILEMNRLIYQYFWECLNKNQEILLQCSKDFKNKINHIVIGQIIDELPNSWVPSKENTEALIEYLIYRLEHLDEICKMIIRK